MDQPHAAQDDLGDAPAPARRPLWRRLLPLGALALVAVAVVASGGARLLSFDALVEHAGALQTFVSERGPAAAALYLAVYTVAVALSVPGALLLTLAGGFLFGGLLGGALAAVSATLGATLLFVVARAAFGDALTRRAGTTFAKLAKGFREDAFGYLLFLRLAPVVPFFIVNLAPAALGVRLKTFVSATALGILPGTFAFAVIGAGLGGLVAAEAEKRAACLARSGGDCVAKLDPSSLVSTPILLALGGFAVAALVPTIARRVRRRRAAASAGP